MTEYLLATPVVEKKLRRRRKPLIPLTLDERLDLMKRELRVPATLDEYFALVQDIDSQFFTKNIAAILRGYLSTSINEYLK